MIAFIAQRLQTPMKVGELKDHLKRLLPKSDWDVLDERVNQCSRETVFVCIFLAALPLPCENFHLASEVLDLSQSPKKTMNMSSDSDVSLGLDCHTLAHV